MALKAYLKRTLEHCPALYAALLRLQAYLHPTAGEPELRLLPILCAADETAIDVGANHGDYSAILVGLARDVIAIEPNPDVARVLEARLREDIRRQRLQVVPGALGAEAGTARLFVPDAGSALASLDARPTATAGKGIEVSVRRLDDVARGCRVGFIKIDVEGHEAAVLHGGMAIITESRPTLRSRSRSAIEMARSRRFAVCCDRWVIAASISIRGASSRSKVSIPNGCRMPPRSIPPAHIVSPAAPTSTTSYSRRVPTCSTSSRCPHPLSEDNMGIDKQRLAQYCASGRKQVHGWLNPVDAEMFLQILLLQDSLGIQGGTAEIGVHHGKSFIPLCLGLHDTTSGRYASTYSRIRHTTPTFPARAAGKSSKAICSVSPYLQTGSSSSRLRRSTSAPSRSSMRLVAYDSSVSTAATGAISWSTIWALPARR